MGVKASEPYKKRLAELVKNQVAKLGSYDKLTVAIALAAGNSPSSELLRKWHNGKFSEEPGAENLSQFAALLGKDLEALQAELRGQESTKKPTTLDLAQAMRQESDLRAIAEAVAIGLKRLAGNSQLIGLGTVGKNPLTLETVVDINSCHSLASGSMTNSLSRLIHQAMQAKGLNPSDRRDVVEFLRNGAFSRNDEILERGIKVVNGTLKDFQGADLAAIAATLTKFTGQRYTQFDIELLLAQTQNPAQFPEQGSDCLTEDHEHNSTT